MVGSVYDHSQDMAKAFEAGRSSLMHSPSLPVPALTVSEIERLAKAGVTVDLDKVSVQSDARAPYFAEIQTLMDPLIHRLRVAFPLGEYSDPGGRKFSFMSAAPIGHPHMGGRSTRVALLVVTVDGNAAMIEDEMTAWPSDALMAKLHLLLETEAKAKPNMSTAPNVGQSQSSAHGPSYAPTGLVRAPRI